MTRELLVLRCGASAVGTKRAGLCGRRVGDVSATEEGPVLTVATGRGATYQCRIGALRTTGPAATLSAWCPSHGRRVSVYVGEITRRLADPPDGQPLFAEFTESAPSKAWYDADVARGYEAAEADEEA